MMKKTEQNDMKLHYINELVVSHSQRLDQRRDSIDQ